jgi:branched-chain amino acid aminotransferase
MSRITEADWIWKDGEFIRWRDANVHLLSLAVQFGSSVFEGIRCYRTPQGGAIFRLNEHIRRLFDSCRIYRIEQRWSFDELKDACTSVVARNGFTQCYIRPMVLRGYGPVSMNPVNCPIETYVPCWEWGAYLGPDALEAGVEACVSSWQRPEPNTFPGFAKAAGHYNNAQLIRMEAVANGYADAIALSPGGLVSEGSGQNVFLVRNGVVITPTLDGTLLHGITRDAILTIAKDLGFPVSAQEVPRESLYTADEVFFTGTAMEVTPVRSIDRIQIGSGRAGPITRQLQKRFMQIVHGEVEDVHNWLTRLPVAAKEVVA